MKTICRSLLKVFLPFGLLAAAFSASALNIVWTNTAGGNWSVSNNWSTHTLPSYDDAVFITNSGTYTINFDLPSANGSYAIPFPLIVSNLLLGGGSSGTGMQTLLITNLQPTSVFAVTNQFILTNGGNLFLSNGVIEGYPVTVDAGSVFTAVNNNFNGSVWVENGGVMNNIANTIAVPLTVTNNGLLTGIAAMVTRGTLNQLYYPTFNSNLTIAAGGTFCATNIALAGITTIQPNGVLNIMQSPLIFGNPQLTGPLTNYGTINMTNSGLVTYNDGTANEQGFVYNGATGRIYFSDQNSATGYGSAIDGTANFVNYGQIIHASGSTITGLIATYGTNFGSVVSESGPIWFQGYWSLAPTSSLTVYLYGATNYGAFAFQPSYYGPGGAIAFYGAFNAVLTNNYIPAAGTAFDVLSYSSYSGSFPSVSLPSTTGEQWQLSYGLTNTLLTVSNAANVLQLSVSQINSTSLLLSGSGGSPNGQYYLLSTTNLALPLARWSTIATNTLTSQGTFQYTLPLNKNQPAQFLAIKSE